MSIEVAKQLRARALDIQTPPLRFFSEAWAWLADEGEAWNAVARWDPHREEMNPIFSCMTEDEIRMALLFIAEAVESEEA